MDVFRNAGVMALASMFVGVLPLAMGILYAIWPTEHRLSLMRPLSLATVFSALAGLAMGLIYELRFVSRAGEAATREVIAMGLAEGLAPVFFGFGCLTAAWLCVTVGLARRP